MHRFLLAAVALIACSPATAADFSSYSGEDLYKRFCAGCHGPKGEGDGPVAAFFKVSVPDLTLITRRQGQFPAEQIHRIIDGRLVKVPHGSREMPIWGYELSVQNVDGSPNFADGDVLIARLVEYLRSIQKLNR
jgi:mono/diheme cytochrome c family protein